MKRRIMRRVFAKTITNPMGSPSLLTVKLEAVEFGDIERANKLLEQGYLEGTPDVHTERLGVFNQAYERYVELERFSQGSAVPAQDILAARSECVRAALAVREVLAQDDFLEHNQKQIDDFVAGFKDRD